MKILKYVILFTLTFLASAFAAFLFEVKYEKLIRFLIEGLTSNKISFIHPRKYIHFASGQFIFTFGSIIVAFILLLRRQNKKQIMLNLIAAIFLLSISTILFCYIIGSAELVECTTCDGGTKLLYYRDINYDLIFMITLITAIVPSALTEIINRKKLRTKRSEKPSTTNIL